MQIFLKEDSLPPKSPILRTPSLPLGQVSHLEDPHMGESNHLLTAADAVAAVDGGAAAEEVVAAAVVAAGVVAVAGVAVGGAVGPEYQFK